MIFKMEIESNNSAFEPDIAKDEVERLLKMVAHDVSIGHAEGGLYDINGNRVGFWIMEEGAD